MAVEQPLARTEFPDERFEQVSDVRARAWPLLGLVVLLVLPFRAWLAARIETPWIMVDELMYAELAKSFAAGGDLLVRETWVGWFNPGYSVLISPAWLVTDSVATSYALAKALNVALSCLVAVPVFLWARRLVSRNYAVLAAGLALLMPGLLYAGTLMAENAFLPAFLLACLAAGLALEQPTRRRQALALAATALAIVVRTQGLVLLAVLPSALLLKAALDARVAPAGRRLRAFAGTVAAFWPSVAFVGLLGALYAAAKLARGQSLLAGLGGYEALGTVEYVSEESLRWVVRHVAGLVLASGYLPFAALLLLVGVAALRGTRTEAERAFVAVAAAAALWITVQAALFATHFSQRIEERYMFHAVPLLLVAFVLWLARGLPRRPWPLAAGAAAVPAALLATAVPLERLLNISILSDTFSLIPLLRLSNLLGSVGEVELLLTVAACVAAAAFVALPRFPAVLVFPAAVGVFFAATTWSAGGAMRDYAAALDQAAGGATPGWIDERLGPDSEVDFLFGGSADPFAEASILWQAEFWNRSVDDVLALGGARVSGLPQATVTAEPLTGRIEAETPVTREADHVVVYGTLALAGRRLASHGPLFLYRVQKPLRLAHRVEGVYGDGWMGARASLMQYTTPGSARRTMRITVSRRAWRGPDVPGRVRIRIGAPVQTAAGISIGRPTAERAWTIHSGAARTFLLRTPRPPFRLEITIDPTFSPASYGFADTRQLGAQVTFELSEPARR